jgi:hypothetical protein
MQYSVQVEKKVNNNKTMYGNANDAVKKRSAWIHFPLDRLSAAWPDARPEHSAYRCLSLA